MTADLDRMDKAELIAALREARAENAKVLDALLGAQQIIEYIRERAVYSDSYGVPGSDFHCCMMCSAGGAPGVKFEHDKDCPIRRAEDYATEQLDYLRAERDEAEAEAARMRDVVEAANAINPIANPHPDPRIINNGVIVPTMEWRRLRGALAALGPTK